MKLHEIYPHNKFIFFTGAILVFTGTYLDSTNKASIYITLPFLVVGCLLVLLGLKKSPNRKSDEL